MSIKTISSREVYRNPWCRVREDVIERSAVRWGDARGIYGVMDKDPACIVIPLERARMGGRVCVAGAAVSVHGGRDVLRVSAGWVGDRGGECGGAGAGELAEETGLRVERMTPLADLWIAYGAMRQIHHVFLAEGLTPGETARDPEEHDMTVHRVAVKEFEAMLLDGRVMDNCTAAAWGVYRVWKDRNRG